ncbi:MAG: hypothetical protein M3Z04_02110 [Chloroflexota bacterium]|nr:hypothetical protein [Chloroflexota bacterium]
MSTRSRRRWGCLVYVPALWLVLLPTAAISRVDTYPISTTNNPTTDRFADPVLQTVWQGAGTVWGAGPFYTSYEPANGTPSGSHLVQYFAGGRLEVNDPGADRRVAGFVTGGRLVAELVAGQIRTGREPDDYEARPATDQPVAGDSGAGAAPAYPAFAALTSDPPPGDRSGAVIDRRLNADGTATQMGNPPAALPLGHYEPRTRHNIAAVFWRFVQAGGAGPRGDWVATLGLPLAEPVWVRAQVGGVGRDLLVQLFERRVLTYDPAGSRTVELTAVGRHYWAWRYADLQPDRKTAAGRTRYDVTVVVGADRSLTVSESIHYVNTTAARVPLRDLVLRAIYGHWVGALRVDGATTGGVALPVRRRDEVNLNIGLPTPLAPGAAIEVTLRFRIQPPRFGGRHGYDVTHDLLTLGDWLPSIVPYENGGWSQFPYGEHGDQGNNAVADYHVLFSSPDALVIGGTGTATRPSSRQWAFYAPSVRDVAYTLSPRLRDPSADPGLSRDAGGVRVLGYFLPEHRAAGGALLDTVAAAIRWYSAQVGPYPYPVFTVGEMALPQAAEWDYAQEYPMVYFLPTQRAGSAPQAGSWTFYTPLHETAHAWFYGAVGNNQLIDPWLDETLANYLTLGYIRAQQPGRFPAALAVLTGPGGGWPVSASLYSGFPSDAAYFHAVYDQGTAFVEAVHTAMGDSRFWAALRAYYRQYNGDRARPRDLLAIWQAYSPTDLLPLFARYLAVW